MKSYHHGNLKEELINFASVICERDGYAKLSIRSLAKESNVSQTAPYRHFKTKEDLYAAVATEGFHKLHKSVLVQSETLSLQVFIQSSISYIDFGLQNANTYDLMFGTAVGDFSAHPDLLEAADTTYEDLASNLALLLAEDDPNIIGEKCITIWALLHGMVGILRKERIVEISKNDLFKQVGPMRTTKEISSNLPAYLEKVLTGIIKS